MYQEGLNQSVLLYNVIITVLVSLYILHYYTTYSNSTK